MKLYKKRIAFLVFYLVFFAFTHAQEPIVLPLLEKEVRVGAFAQYYEDNALLTIEQISSPTFESKWKNSTQRDINFGYTNEIGRAHV